MRNNTLDLGSMFEFRHNFAQVQISDGIIINNKGYFMDMIPSNTYDRTQF